MPTVFARPHSTRPVEPTHGLLTARMSPPASRSPIGATPKAPGAGSLASIGRATADARMPFVPARPPLFSPSRKPFDLLMAPAPFVLPSYRPPTPTVATPSLATTLPLVATPDTAVSAARARQPRLLLGGD